jgi:tetratricopeptide (TPR) repeat protein
MAEQKNKITIIAARSGIIVEAKKLKRNLHLGWRLFVLGVCVVAVVAIAVVLLLFTRRDQHHKVAVIQQKTLESNITDVNAVGDMNKLGNDSDMLIKGSQSGDYQVSDKQLAQAYANRGDVEFNQQAYKAAVDDYKKAVSLNGDQQDLVGYNEFVARYHLGERDTLLPLLVTLQKPYKNNHDIGAPEHYDQYQGYIDSLKAGKELDV